MIKIGRNIFKKYHSHLSSVGCVVIVVINCSKLQRFRFRWRLDYGYQFTVPIAATRIKPYQPGDLRSLTFLSSITVIYIKIKDNFTDNITHEFTFNSLALHLLALVHLRDNLSSLSFALVLDVTNWLLQVPTQNSQRRDSSILLLPPHYSKICTYFCFIFCQNYPILFNSGSNFTNPLCTPSSTPVVFAISFPSASSKMFYIVRR